MESGIHYRRNAARLLAIVCASALVWFGNGLNPCWPLLWFAPLPVLLVAAGSSRRVAALTAALSWLAGSLNMWHYFRVLHAPPYVWTLNFGIAALVFMAGVLVYRSLLLRGAAWSALLAFPATWVSCEYLLNLSSPHGTAGSLSYSQLDFLPFLQLASVTGPWGMSFLLLLFPSAVALGLHLRRTAPKQAWHIVAAGLSVLGLVLIFGVVRLNSATPGRQVRVGLIASDLAANVDVAREGAATARLFRDYAGEARKLAARGAQVIVLPEKLGVVLDSDSISVDGILQAVADETKSALIAGLIYVSPPVKYNCARVYAPGTPPLNYDKRHMLPPFESEFKPGATLTLMPQPSGTWGVAICKDMDFTPLSRRYGEAGVGLMLVPAWDFVIDRSWHGHMAVMRGVESGFSVARAARQGYMTVSDTRGRILGEAPSGSAPFATLVVDVPVVHEATLYLLLGDWFAWFALAILVCCLLRLYRSRKYSPAAEDLAPHDRPDRHPLPIERLDV